MNILIIEQEPDYFYPVSDIRPLWDLRMGAFLFRERIEKFLLGEGIRPEGIHYTTREDLVPLYSRIMPERKVSVAPEKVEQDTLVCSATIVPGRDLLDLQPGEGLFQDDQCIAAYLSSGSALPQDLNDFGKLRGREATESRFFRYHWELMGSNGDIIIEDLGYTDLPAGNKKDVTILGEATRFYCHEDAEVEPMVLVDCREGPVLIEEGARIHAFTRIEGPAVIGRGTHVLGARIREGTTLGPVCRIGGEVETSIFQGYSNKYHEGFIGHSYIGQWVNIGAISTNSDLKNSYLPVSVYTPAGMKETGMVKVGTAMGDFSKCSIGTMINTGSVIGMGAMLVHDGNLTPPHVPPFAWLTDGEIVYRTRPHGFVAGVRRMMNRRGLEPESELEALLLKRIAEATG
jgi:UDP-N-acetylglucosamine diphosphorylase/glucosamine-1-phosphate N-acetyltransferase